MSVKICREQANRFENGNPCKWCGNAIYRGFGHYLVKDKGDMDFIIDILKENQIRTYWERQWYRESFYLLAMVYCEI